MSILKKNPNYPLALQIATRLKEEGFKTLFAGGCIRDAFLQNPAGDIDLATEATPPQIQALFKKTLAVGAQFGVVVVLCKNIPFEVATFRTDSIYKDGRRPEKVFFSNDKEDAKRRDFTINGLFYDPFTDKVLDYVGGVKDIHNKVIRTIGNPQDRFTEDKLRLLRAVRFSAKLDFSLDLETFLWIKKMAPSLCVVSRERIRDEIFKIFNTSNPLKALTLMQELDLWKPVFLFSFEEKNLRLFCALPFSLSPELKLLALCPHLNEKDLKKMASYFKLSTKQTQKILFTLKLLSSLKDFSKLRLSLQKRIFRNPFFQEAFLFLQAYQPLMKKKEEKTIRFILSQYQQCQNFLYYPKLISGEDLIKLNLQPSPLFKLILEEIENLQLEEKITTQEEALKVAQELIRQQHENSI